MSEFAIKDSGARQEFSGGMVRDTTEGKVNFLNVRIGPMLRRWATHLTKGREKYPDPMPGVPNWTLASGVEEYLRAKESAARHFEQWLAGDRDEDHAAGVFFNINLAEYVLENNPFVSPSGGVTGATEAALENQKAEAEAAAYFHDEQPEPFEVGDRVRVVATADGEFDGKTGTVTDPPHWVTADGLSRWDYWVSMMGGTLGFTAEELELA